MATAVIWLLGACALPYALLPWRAQLNGCQHTMQDHVAWQADTALDFMRACFCRVCNSSCKLIA